MDPETKELLKNTFRLAEENNEMLKKVRNVQKRETLFSFLKVLFWIGVTFGAFYFVQPYVEKAHKITEEISSSFDNVKNILPR